jgi:DNA-binding XRE family transcriptional regulator
MTDEMTYANSPFFTVAQPLDGVKIRLLKDKEIPMPIDKERLALAEKAKQMILVKLAENRHKGTWKNTSLNELQNLLHGEVEELFEELSKPYHEQLIDIDAAQKEVADVMNYAMMIFEALENMRGACGDQEKLGDLLREGRLKKGASLPQLAREVEIDETMLTEIENNERMPSMKLLNKICCFLWGGMLSRFAHPSTGTKDHQAI